MPSYTDRTNIIYTHERDWKKDGEAWVDGSQCWSVTVTTNYGSVICWAHVKPDGTCSHLSMEYVCSFGRKAERIYRSLRALPTKRGIALMATRFAKEKKHG